MELINPIIYDADEVSIQYILLKMQMKSIRDSSHMTQKDVSDRSGLSTKCISDIESYKVGNPTLLSMMKYLQVLGYELHIRKTVI